MSFPCPNCGHPQTCPCPSCQASNATEKPWKWDGEFIECAGCGLKKHCDWWLDQEVKFVEALHGKD